LEEGFFHPEIVGRENELKLLTKHLDEALEGKGNTVFISGEAGVGKTRLVEELKKIATTRGCLVLSGNSLVESLTPYMPFFDALRSGNLQHLFAETAPKVDGVYLMTNSGLPISKLLREEMKLDPDVFASMFSVIENFVKDTLDSAATQEKGETLSRIGYGDHTILVEEGTNANLIVTLTGKENEFLINDMKEILRKVQRFYGNVLDRWDGDESLVDGVSGLLGSLISSGRYDGVLYGSDEPAVRRNLLFENVLMGLTRQAMTLPTILCIEDIQWADPSSLALIHYISRNTRDFSLFILGTYRPEDITKFEGRGHPLTSTMRIMNREDILERIELQRLPREDIPNIVSAMLGVNEFRDDFFETVYRETEGNPLFIMEFMKFLVGEKIIGISDGTWKLHRNLDELKIPNRIFDVIVRRLDLVGNEQRVMLDYASIIGELFDSDVLASALEIERLQLLEQLKVLEKEHRLIHSHDGGFKFDHTKIKEVLYAEIPVKLREEYHSIIAKTIESLYGDKLDSMIEELAFHYSRCKNKKKALHYLYQAGRKAEKNYSNDEAIRFYHEALEYEGDPDRIRDICENLGGIYDLIGNFDKSLEFFGKALKAAKGSERIALIELKIAAEHIKKGEFDKGDQRCDGVIEFVADNECEEKARALNLKGIIKQRKGMFNEALDDFSESLRIAKKIGDKKVISATHGNMGTVYSILGNIDESIQNSEESLRIAEEIGDFRGLAISYENIGNRQLGIGNYEKALEYLNKSLEISERIGDQEAVARTINNIGTLYGNTEEYEKALVFFKKSLEISERIDFQRQISVCLNNIGDIKFYIGHYDEALDYFKKGLEIAEKTGDHRGMARICCDIAEIYFEKRDLNTTEDFTNKSLNLSSKLGLKEDLAKSLRLLGMIRREEKKWQDSIENFEESIRIFKSQESGRRLGQSHYEFGLMWEDKGDIKMAKEHLNKAIGIFEKFKLLKDVKKGREAYKRLHQ
jgi:predicted ATPase